MATATGLQFEIQTPTCAPGIGSVILSPDAPDLITGVRVHPGTIWPDDRGYFLEVMRMGLGPASEFSATTTQVSAALSYPGTIKAFHFHRRQCDYWAPVGGMLQVALVDLRPASETFGRKNTMYIGALRPWQILIPPGVAHGYKVLGGDPAVLVYVTDKFYDPADEGRLPYNDGQIQYDWEIQHK